MYGKKHKAIFRQFSRWQICGAGRTSQSFKTYIHFEHDPFSLFLHHEHTFIYLNIVKRLLGLLEAHIENDPRREMRRKFIPFEGIEGRGEEDKSRAGGRIWQLLHNKPRIIFISYRN